MATETNIVDATRELKDIIVESGSMAESLFERVDMGYKVINTWFWLVDTTLNLLSAWWQELEEEIKGLSNVEQVLLDTADSVMDTKRKIEFGVQQIIYKVEKIWLG